VWGSVSLNGAISVMLVGGITGGVAYVAFFTIFMQWASPEQAGTDFTVLQCTESCTNIVAAIVAGQLAALIGFPGLFAAASLVGIVAIAWIAFALMRQAHTSAASPAQIPQENA
jgi:MFS transporter (putative signal transducer)